MNGLNTNQLLTSNSASDTHVTRTRTDINCIASSGTWGILVYTRSTGGVETLIAGSTSNPLAQVSFTGSTITALTATAAIPLTHLNTGDSIIVRTYARLTGLDSGFTLIEPNSGWQTGQLGSSTVNHLTGITWTVKYWGEFTVNTNCGISGSSETSFYFGISTHDSQIQNFQYGTDYTAPLIWSPSTTWSAGETVTWNINSSININTSWLGNFTFTHFPGGGFTRCPSGDLPDNLGVCPQPPPLWFAVLFTLPYAVPTWIGLAAVIGITGITTDQYRRNRKRRYAHRNMKNPAKTEHRKRGFQRND